MVLAMSSMSSLILDINGAAYRMKRPGIARAYLVPTDENCD
jgi:hypothetical protein